MRYKIVMVFYLHSVALGKQFKGFTSGYNNIPFSILYFEHGNVSQMKTPPVTLGWINFRYISHSLSFVDYVLGYIVCQQQEDVILASLAYRYTKNIREHQSTDAVLMAIWKIFTLFRHHLFDHLVFYEVPLKAIPINDFSFC